MSGFTLAKQIATQQFGFDVDSETKFIDFVRSRGQRDHANNRELDTQTMSEETAVTLLCGVADDLLVYAHYLEVRIATLEAEVEALHSAYFKQEEEE